MKRWTSESPEPRLSAFRGSMSRDSEMALPVLMVCAAASRVSLVIRLRVPSRSFSPHRPQLDRDVMYCSTSASEISPLVLVAASLVITHASSYLVLLSSTSGAYGLTHAMNGAGSAALERAVRT